MTLTSGTKLGPYEILAPIGAGGMGEVYKARDSRLERTVAVKVLPSHMSASPESRQRFEREAKTISQLSHPHICALYDVGREGETEYLVMEYLEGEPLSDRLEKGALPLRNIYTLGIYFLRRIRHVRAKLFQSGGSQAVRLPKEFRFVGRKEVLIYRQSGRVVLEAPRKEWSRRFRALAGACKDFPYSRERRVAERGPDFD